MQFICQEISSTRFSISLGMHPHLFAFNECFGSMFDINFLFEFSREHCIAICACMVPASLLLTLRTLLLVGLHHSQAQVQRAGIIASLAALTLLLHDFSWFIVGVVMAPTYVLLTLVFVCLSLNIWAIVHPTSINQLLRQVLMRLARWKTLGKLENRDSIVSPLVTSHG
jgi:hypothetical protein